MCFLKLTADQVLTFGYIAYGWRNGAIFTKFIFIHIQRFIIVYEYIYSHSTTKFIFKKYIKSHLTAYVLFTNIFTHIYEMHSFTFNGVYSFTFTIEILVNTVQYSFSTFCARPSRIIGPSSRSIISQRSMADEGRTII